MTTIEDLYRRMEALAQETADLRRDIEALKAVEKMRWVRAAEALDFKEWNARCYALAKTLKGTGPRQQDPDF